jgi:hypothetical protein
MVTPAALTCLEPLLGHESHWKVEQNEMARSDLLLSIVKAGISKDSDGLRTSVEAVVADERKKIIIWWLTD